MTDNTSAKKEKGSFFKNLKLEFKKIIWPDRIEIVQVLNWNCVAKKGEFKEGDMVIYFEIENFRTRSLKLPFLCRT